MIPNPSRRIQTQPPHHLQPLLLLPFGRTLPSLKNLYFLLLLLGGGGGNAKPLTWYQLNGVPDAGSPLGEGVEAADEGDGGGGVEAGDVDELAKVELAGGDEVGVGVGDGDVGGVKRVREFEEVAAAL